MVETDLGLSNKPPGSWLFGPLARSWVRGVLLGLVLLVAAGTVYYKLVVAPTLTATRLELWAAGEDRRVTVGVDDETGVVTVSAGQAGLSEFVVVGNSLFVLAAEVGAGDEGARWVELPLDAVDPRFSALTPERLVPALTRGTKECREPSDDAKVLLALSLAVPTGPGESLCGSAWRHAAEVDRDALVDEEAINPSDLTGAPTTSVLLVTDSTNPESVLDIVNQLLSP